jgi:hypothetical protein
MRSSNTKETNNVTTENQNDREKKAAGAALMALSTIVVAINASFLKIK